MRGDGGGKKRNERRRHGLNALFVSPLLAAVSPFVIRTEAKSLFFPGGRRRRERGSFSDLPPRGRERLPSGHPFSSVSSLLLLLQTERKEKENRDKGVFFFFPASSVLLLLFYPLLQYSLSASFPPPLSAGLCTVLYIVQHYGRRRHTTKQCMRVPYTSA